ncbi:hypothetical protein H310_10852 [Aphanomyces invadans]|uniref:Uncharacterized protein n=1 Tax=Aphanomyces invadans TaxID=157072 RepID=A0A024TR15_9STRA|nr:hypothetical protein H310_10852 [Aphanomyces invadans]ETV95797.1 hypothetical protein H310_10852 [Aphanomyces invadans]|eukprot:XP_008875548.1 hypothetical protein H310_10852 [Aphanomyces invadans]
MVPAALRPGHEENSKPCATQERFADIPHGAAVCFLPTAIACAAPRKPATATHGYATTIARWTPWTHVLWSVHGSFVAIPKSFRGFESAPVGWEASDCFDRDGNHPATVHGRNTVRRFICTAPEATFMR